MVIESYINGRYTSNLRVKLSWGSFRVKSTQKIDDPSGFSSNLVRPMHIQSNLATPNFYPIREVFLELWSVESVNFGEILSILAVP